MSESDLGTRFADFVANNRFITKGPISIALVVTQHARELGLPLDADDLLADSGTQVRGAGGAQVQAILKRHNIDRQFSSEGGRTSRGSVPKMRAYVAFLNEEANLGTVDFDAIEKLWVGKVKEFFAAKPFKLSQDASKSLSAVIADLFEQAYIAQENLPGVQYAGAMLQHLVGAKLESVLDEGVVTHHSFSTSDASTNRDGDFVIGDVAIHVTTAPSDAVMRRCIDNLAKGKKPILITLPEKPLNAANVLADVAGVTDRLDIYDIGQYLSAVVWERGAFANPTTAQALAQLLTRYNAIVEAAENDPSLKVAW